MNQSTGGSRRPSQRVKSRVIWAEVITRFHYQEYYFIHSVVMVPHLRRKGCWALSDVHSPRIATHLMNAISCNRLNEETTEVT